jgi:hypothetical protein
VVSGINKGQQSRIGNQINDGAFEAMMEAIQTDRTPNFYFMQYELGSATVPVAVGNVPLRTFFPPSVRRDADRRARDARAPHFTRELEKLHPDNPVNYTVTRGRNPPATSGVTRPRTFDSSRPR